jgi:hypothetical protein
MKTINNYIYERLILSKTGKQQEITFDMLFDLIRKNAPEEDIYFSSIFGHDNKIFLDKNYSNKSNKFYPGLELETLIVYNHFRIIELTQVDDDNNMWTAARIGNNAELYEAFEPEVIECIYNYIENYKK